MALPLRYEKYNFGENSRDGMWRVFSLKASGDKARRRGTYIESSIPWTGGEGFFFMGETYRIDKSSSAICIPEINESQK